MSPPLIVTDSPKIYKKFSSFDEEGLKTADQRPVDVEPDSIEEIASNQPLAGVNLVNAGWRLTERAHYDRT